MIETDRLMLRDLTPADFAAVHEYASDSLVTRFTSFGRNTPDETRDFLARSSAAAGCKTVTAPAGTMRLASTEMPGARVSARKPPARWLNSDSAA